MKNRNAMIVYLCSAIVAVVLLLVYRSQLQGDYKFLIIGISSILLLAPLGLLKGNEIEDEYKRLENRKNSLLILCFFTVTSLLLLVVGIVPFAVELTSNLFTIAFICCVAADALLAGALFINHNPKKA